MKDGVGAHRFNPSLGLSNIFVRLERLQSVTDMRFIERGLPTNLVPTRDEGLELFGDIGGACCPTPSACSMGHPI